MTGAENIWEKGKSFRERRKALWIRENNRDYRK